MYNSEDHSQTCGNIVFRTFDPVTVQISLNRSNIQHEKLIFKLVKPFVSKLLLRKQINTNCFYIVQCS